MMCPAPPAAPDRMTVAISPVPTNTIMPRLRSGAHGKHGRPVKGTSQALFSAFCTATATPRGPSLPSRGWAGVSSLNIASSLLAPL